MSDDAFEQLMRDSASEYRPPPEPPLERMWGRIEAEVFAPRVLGLRPRRRLQVLAYAATLLLGITMGLAYSRLRDPAPPEPAVGPATAAVFVDFPNPFVGVATDYLQQTTALLITVAGEIRDGRVPSATIGQARHLLSTTRLLLDAGVTDPALHDLLEDLELVLAQVVQLPGTRQAPDAALITEALDEREVLPRLTLLLADAGVAP